jgi:hypothetical protein
MAFDATKMSCVSYGGGQHLWLYNTDDPSATVRGTTYFTLTNMPLLAVNDIIICTDKTNVYTLAVTAMNSAANSVVYKGPGWAG